MGAALALHAFLFLWSWALGTENRGPCLRWCRSNVTWRSRCRETRQPASIATLFSSLLSSHLSSLDTHHRHPHVGGGVQRDASSTPKRLQSEQHPTCRPPWTWSRWRASHLQSPAPGDFKYFKSRPFAVPGAEEHVRCPENSIVRLLAPSTSASLRFRFRRESSISQSPTTRWSRLGEAEQARHSCSWQQHTGRWVPNRIHGPAGRRIPTVAICRTSRLH